MMIPASTRRPKSAPGEETARLAVQYVRLPGDPAAIDRRDLEISGIHIWQPPCSENGNKMNPLLTRTFCAVGATMAIICGSVRAESAQSQTARIVTAANTFLATLDPKQKASVSFKFDDEQQRARWSNLPTTMVRRAGLSMGELNEAQRSAALALVASALSRRGYEKVQQIMEGDEILNGKEPARHMFGKDLFYISLLGTPSEKDPWMLQFGGHHLALNITLIGEHGVFTPTHTAAQPALYQLNGRTIRPLGQENDKAFTLLNALDDGQRKKAILSFKVADLVLGPGHDGQTIQPEGLKASDMNDKQRQMLLDLVSEWTGIASDSFADARMAEVKAGLDDTWFAWSGPTTIEPGKNGSAYFRVQGPKLVIEYAPQRLGGDLTMHIHTMYRDPTNDYGRAPTKQ